MQPIKFEILTLHICMTEYKHVHVLIDAGQLLSDTDATHLTIVFMGSIRFSIEKDVKIN